MVIGCCVYRGREVGGLGGGESEEASGGKSMWCADSLEGCREKGLDGAGFGSTDDDDGGRCLMLGVMSGIGSRFGGYDCRVILLKWEA